MRLQTFQKLCCPLDKSGLRLQIITQGPDQQVLEGMLTCEHCQRKYPVIHGVPVMSPDEYRDFGLEQPVIDRWQGALAKAETYFLGN